MTTTVSTMNAPETASAPNAKIMMTGTNVISVLTPNLAAMRPVRNTWEMTVRLCTIQSKRAKMRVRSFELRKRELDQAQLLEIQQRVDHRNKHDEQRDAEHVRRTQDQRHARERIAADRSILGLVGRIGAAGPQTQQDALAENGRNKQRRAEEQHAAVADGADGEIGNQRAAQRARAAARRDHAEQALGLLRDRRAPAGSSRRSISGTD